MVRRGRHSGKVSEGDTVVRRGRYSGKERETQW